MWVCFWFLCFAFLQKAPAKPKKAKEVEKAKPEEKAPEAPAENGEAKAEEEVTATITHINMQNEVLSSWWWEFDSLIFVSQAPATDAAEEKDEAAE